MTAPPRLFDRDLHRARLDRAAPGYGAADFLKARAAADAVERLEAIMRDFPLAVDLGARNGAFAAALAQSEAKAKVGALIEADLSRQMLADRPGLKVQADEERLPFAPESLNLVVSLLNLHWTNDLVGALIQIREALKPDGLFLGALLGGAEARRPVPRRPPRRRDPDRTARMPDPGRGRTVRRRGPARLALRRRAGRRGPAATRRLRPARGRPRPGDRALFERPGADP